MAYLLFPFLRNQGFVARILSFKPFFFSLFLFRLSGVFVVIVLFCFDVTVVLFCFVVVVVASGNRIISVFSPD